MSETASALRVERLLGGMTLVEKIGQLTMAAAPDLTTGPLASSDLEADVRAGRVGHVLNLVGRERIAALQKVAREESRLGIPFIPCLDVLHGYRTIFPVPLAEAASFDPGLWERTARVAAAEAAADGLMLTFAPMLDVCRDPRWGRIVEGPGEDPWLASAFARAKVRGFQGRRPGGLRAGRLAATAKHIGAYGAVNAGLDYGAVDISERQLREVHLPAFKAAVEAGVAAVMPAFVALAGTPATANRDLLTGLLRESWGFDGVVVSDYHAIPELMAHGVASDLTEAAALALRAGVDIDMMGSAFAQGLPAALERGLVSMAQIDAAVRRVLALKERLGLFDAASRPGARPAARRLRDEPRALARHVAARSMVLLRNEQGVLPLAQAGPPIYLVGAHARGEGDQLGPWSAEGAQEPVENLLDALRRAFPLRRIELMPRAWEEVGKPIQAPPVDGVLVLCLGEDSGMSGEAASRAEPVMPPEQVDLVQRTAALGMPLVLVLWTGRPLVMMGTLGRVDAALVAWFPGSEGPAAVADILAGLSDPGGRLPVTWPASVGQVPIFFGQRPSGRPFEPGNHYSAQYLDESPGPLFPFGHGLSYARFSIRIRDIAPGRRTTPGPYRVVVDVTNHATRSGRATVFLFIRDRVARIARPMLELRGVQTLELAAGETRLVTLLLAWSDFAALGDEPSQGVEAGEVEIFAGPSADLAVLDRRVVLLPPADSVATRAGPAGDELVGSRRQTIVGGTPVNKGRRR
jgi:beta-glucosidase